MRKRETDFNRGYPPVRLRSPMGQAGQALRGDKIWRGLEKGFLYKYISICVYTYGVF